MPTPDSTRTTAVWLEPALALMLFALTAISSSGEQSPLVWVIDAATCLGAAASYRFPRSAAAVVLAGQIAWLLIPGLWPSIAGLAFIVNIFAAMRQRLPWRIPLAIMLAVPGYLLMVERSALPAERATPAALMLFLLVLAWGGGEFWVRARALIQLERERAEMDRAELRLALARDLHDTVAQTLSRAAMSANVLLAEPELGEDTRTELRRIAEECRSSAHDLRSMLASLRKDDRVPLPGPGLPSGSADLRETVDAQVDRLVAAGFTVDADVDAEGVSAAQAQTLSAVTLEMANNVLKHAVPRTGCRIRIGTTGDDVVATYQNVPLRTTASRQGLGLIGVRERLALLNGGCDVHYDSRSWTLTARLPRS